jgi:alanyl-tRNA synthetase
MLMNAKEIRQIFLDFFEEKGHHIVPSAPMVLKNDPTLMFTNAGMNPFKDLFLGHAEVVQSRIADTQKCLRVSGKHNDLEEVGLDTYHHTMFEMLGNWSFGDYFKKEAIAWAWELLADRYGIDKDRMYFTYFGGDDAEGLEPDLEARDLWGQFTTADRIIPGSKKDNFWEMGDTGPCGPCSEIHVDIRSEEERNRVSGRSLVNMGHPQVIEIWNLVFMQFNRLADGRLQPLPARHVDTGMGFERLCMVLQGKSSNYDTDVFTPFIQALENKTGLSYGKDEKVDIAMRVISDHIRAVGIAIADGQLPSNTGAGYVIRRILRRAIRYGFSFLSLRQPFMTDLVAVLRQTLGNTFPEITSQETFITKVIREEEVSFLRTLEKGLQRIGELLVVTPVGAPVSGEKAFELYDTFGFPIDLTRLIAAENGRTVDEAGFEQALNAQKERSRAVGKTEAGDWVVLQDTKQIQFVGYDALEAEAHIVKYRTVVQKGKTEVQVVLNQTPFYAESGGQIGDTGQLVSAHETLEVLDTVKENDLIIHRVHRIPEAPEASFTATVDVTRRKAIRANHSATHLLHAALREVLGKHVEQRGSLVTDAGLRFDFSHPAKLTAEEWEKVENLVNEKIRANIPLNEQRDVPMAEASKMGAMALFGEKYGDKVRVITFDATYSVELCGGTHVTATGEIGLCLLKSEASVAAGIRRIEAITGVHALQEVVGYRQTLQVLREKLKNPKDPVRGADALLIENEQLNAELAKLQAAETQRVQEHLLASAEIINGIQVIQAMVGLNAEQIRQVAFALKTKIGLVMVLGVSHPEKPGLSIMVSEDLVAAGKSAVETIRQAAVHIQGGGGGQPFFATAGGKQNAGLKKAMETAVALLTQP